MNHCSVAMVWVTVVREGCGQDDSELFSLDNWGRVEKGGGGEDEDEEGNGFSRQHPLYRVFGDI